MRRMGKKAFNFFRIWGNLVLAAITVYPFIIAAFFPDISQEGELNSLFGWSWQTWLIVFLISIILTLSIQSWLEKYDQDGVGNASNVARSDRGGITVQGEGNRPIIGSFNTDFTIPPAGYEAPTRAQLLHKIGIEVQKFYFEFQRIPMLPKGDLVEKFEESNKHLGIIRMELLMEANLLLNNTEIPKLIDDLFNLFNN